MCIKLQGRSPTIVTSFHVCSKEEFSLSPFKTVLGIVVTFFSSPSPFYPIDAVEKLCLELVRVGNLTKRRPWYFFVVCETISLPRNRFCLITQRFSVCWGRALRDEAKTAARETGVRTHKSSINTASQTLIQTSKPQS